MVAMQEQQNANLLLNLGTSGQISFLLESLPSPESPQQNLKSLSGMELRPYPNGYLAVGATLSGGKSFDILAELFTEVLAFFGHQTSKAEVYRTIHKQVLQWHEHGQKLSLEQSLHVQPYFYGTREQPDAKGAILNIGAANLRVLPLLYGFTEAMVRELHELWLASGLANTHSVCSNIVGSGNAIRRNPMIKPIIENMFGA